jgi:uncharacterized membrane protein YkoI
MREKPITRRPRNTRASLYGYASRSLRLTEFDHLLIAKNNHGSSDGISLDEAVKQARQRNKGKVLSAETTRVDGRKIYHIKILTKDGRVKRTRIDARTGKTISRGH